MLSYDDPESIGRKTDYVIAEGLGGIMFWELSGDDKESSLLTAISSRLKA
jgi:chitinase